MEPFKLELTKTSSIAEAFEVSIENTATRGDRGKGGGRNERFRKELEERQARQNEAQKWNQQYSRNASKYDDNAYPGTEIGLPPPISNSYQDMQEYLEAYDALRIKEIERHCKRFNIQMPDGKGATLLKHRLEKGHVDAYGVLQGDNTADTLPASAYPPLTAKEIERRKKVNARVNKGSALGKNRPPKVRGKERTSLAPDVLQNRRIGPDPSTIRTMGSHYESRPTETIPKTPSAPTKKRKLLPWEIEAGFSEPPSNTDLQTTGGKQRQSLLPSAFTPRKTIAPTKSGPKPGPSRPVGTSNEGRQTGTTRKASSALNTLPKLQLPTKSDHRPPSPTKSDHRPPSPTKRYHRPPSPTKSDHRPPSPAKSDLRPPSPAKSRLRQPSPAKSRLRQPSTAASRLRQPSSISNRPTHTSSTASSIPQAPSTASGIPQAPSTVSGIPRAPSTARSLRQPKTYSKPPQAKLPQRQSSPERETVKAQYTQQQFEKIAARFSADPGNIEGIGKRLKERFEQRAATARPKTSEGEKTLQELADEQMERLMQRSPTQVIYVMNTDGTRSKRRIRVPTDLTQEDGALIEYDPRTNTVKRASPNMIYFDPRTSPAYSVPSPSRTPPGPPPPELLQIRLVSPQSIAAREAFNRLGGDGDDGLDGVNLEDVDLDLVSPGSSSYSRISQTTPKRRFPRERLQREAERTVTRISRAEQRRLRKSPEHLSFDRLAEDFDGGLDDEVLEDPEEIRLVSPPSPSRSRRSPRSPEEVNIVTPPSSRPQTQPRSKSPRRSPRRPASQPEAISPGERVRREAEDMIARINAAERNRLAALDRDEDRTIRNLKERLHAVRENFIDAAEAKRNINETLEARYEEAERRRKAAKVATPQVVPDPPPPPPLPRSPPPRREKPRWRKEEMDGAPAPAMSPAAATAEAALKKVVENVMENLRDISRNAGIVMEEVASSPPRATTQVISNLQDLVDEVKNSLNPQ